MTCAFSGAAYRNRTDDLFITRELHTRRALNWLASAASTMATQQGQHDQTEVMYAQNAPTRTPLVVWTCAVERRDTSVLHESERPRNLAEGVTPLRPQQAFCSAHRLELQPQASLLLKLLKSEVAEQFAHDHALLAEVEDCVICVDGVHASDPGQRVSAILDQFAVPVAREQFHDHENLLRADREVHGATDRGNRVLAAGVPVGQVAGCRHLERAKHADVEVATTHHPERVGLVEI